MCGLTGFFDFNHKSDIGDLRRMTETLVHRGPDDHGTDVVRHDQFVGGFGHRRLSIIDLSERGRQPMQYEDGRFIILLNGEIYNYKEIGKELLSAGHTLQTDSDTEVAMKALAHWGPEAVQKFIGMFAIVFTDMEKQKTWLIRDRAGVKPLYYYYKDGLFLFGSELKALMAHPNFVKEIFTPSLSMYFTDGYISAPSTIFKDTLKVKPGEVLSLDLTNRRIETKEYWSVLDAYNQPKMGLSFDEATEALEELLARAFSYRMVSDVPVGVFLSGGFDSSTLTALVQSQIESNVRTYTIGFENKRFNEAGYAKEVANILGTVHTEMFCTEKEALEIIPDHPFIYDEPFGDSSAIPTTLLSRLTGRHVKVALSSDGGDELFGGYLKYSRALKFSKVHQFLPGFIRQLTVGGLKIMGPVLLPFLRRAYNMESRYYKTTEILSRDAISDIMRSGNQFFSFKEYEKLVKDPRALPDSTFNDWQKLNPGNDLLSQMQAIDYATYLPDDILRKVDRATMSVGLEGRDPYLDHNIVEFAAQLPSSFKRDNGADKKILRAVTYKYLPKELMDRPKMGFEVPLADWFRGPLSGFVRDVLSYENIPNELLNSKEIVNRTDHFLKGGKDNPQKIWLLLAFQMWYSKWMKS